MLISNAVKYHYCMLYQIEVIHMTAAKLHYIGLIFVYNREIEREIKNK